LIHISESFTDKSSVVIKVQGALNRESLHLLEEIYQEHVKENNRIAIDLEGITVVDRTGKNFLKKIQDDVRFVRMPAYLELEIGQR